MLLKFCLILIIVNSLTIGGGFVMIPLLQKEFVDKYHWITNQEFLDAIAVGQVTPGPLTVMNAFIGYKIFGIVGSILAMVCSYLPSFIITTLVVKNYFRYKESFVVNASFNGIKPAVIGLLSAVALLLGKTAIIDYITFGIAAVGFILLAFTRIEPTFVILGAGILGAIFL